MQIVLGIKETLQKIYRKYDIYIIPFMKFLTALIVFMSINGQLGYMEKANNMIIVLVLALLCSFLPSNTVLLFSTALVLAHFYAHSLPVFITGGGMVLILMIAYFGIAPREGYALMLTPIAFACHLPGFVPLAFGLLGGPVSAIGVAIGTLLYYVIDAFSGLQPLAAGADKMDVKEIMAAADQVKEMLDNIAKDKTMFVMAVAMAATLVIVWLIRKIAFKYAWSIAIAAGAVVYIVCVIFGGAALGTEISMGGTIVGMLIAAALALVLQIFLFSLDYTRTQIVQFEDDDYYYYVKAVPKQKSGDIAVKERGRHRDA